jgi:putative heme-binding domain-containing protein
MNRRLLATLAAILLFAPFAQAQQLELKKGDHICIVGNTLAERMQHFGWLETLIQARFPEHNLVIRNLGYSGDEIDGWKNPQHRMRSMSFGSHDEWLSGNAPCPQPGKLSSRDKEEGAKRVRENRFELTNTRADVVFAFYGYNESWAGEAGLPAFRQNVDEFIKHTLSQKYNGRSAPKLVLFSPIAHEFLNDPNLPSQADVEASNARLKMYSDAMGEVAKANGVKFVDLFKSRIDPEVLKAGISGRTINGIHQNWEGDYSIALYAEEGLFGVNNSNAPGLLFPPHEKLRSAVLDKNFYWFNRYRVTDGYSTYGDRAFLKFSEGPGGYGDGLSNYSVGQRELDVLDVMTSNRDKVIWAAAQGKQIKADDSNIPQFIPVISNKPGELPGGKHKFLSGQEAIEKMTIGKGLKVELFADEKMFPELVNPVQMAFDTKGRLWVAAWRTYPHWKPTEPMNDKLLILEDTNGDGRADVCKTFAGDIHNPTGFEFWNGGVLVAQGPDLLFLKDTNGDDKYDIKERLVHGFDTADTHHTINSFTLDPGGAVYMQEGTFHHSQIETPWGAPRRVANGAVFRYEPRQQKTDIYVTFGFANPHGHAFDPWGQDIVCDGTGANPFHGPLFSSYLEFPNKHNRPPQVYQQRTRPLPAIEFLNSSHFPDEFRDNLLVPNVIGFQGILRYKMEDKDSSLGATELEPILFSSDPNFRPADVEVGPDGAIYFTDWQNPIIGHMQHNLRDPNRDQEHGRVYRVRYEGRKLVKPEPIAGQPTVNVLALLAHPDDRVRYRARIELSGRKWDDIEKALRLISPPPGNDAYHMFAELLWLHQSHNVINLKVLEFTLTCPDFRARAAAVRVLAAWRDDLLGLPANLPSGASVSHAREQSQRKAIELLLKAAADPAPRVRLMALWAASFIPKPEAYEVLLVAAEHPTDQYLDFLSKEVARTLQPLYDQAKKEGREIAFATEAGARFALKNLPTDELLKQDKTKAVCLELLYRPGLQDPVRRDAVRTLAKLDNKPELRVVMDTILNLDAKQSNADTTVVFDLVRQLTGRSAAELKDARAELEKLATAAKQPIFRQIGYVSLINVDDNVDASWKIATTDPKRLIDFVNAMPLISDPGIRATLYERVEPLLTDLPEPLRGPKSNGTNGRIVRVEIPGKGTLTLAEVEVMSGGENVARKGRASQKNTAHDGDAKRAIDGNKSGTYADGGQTHTEENTNNPYWEVDLGDEYPIDQIVIYNRTEIPDRLNNFTLKVLDEKRGEIFKSEKNPAPKVKAEFALAGGGPESLVRRAAMNALTYVRGQEPKTFATLAKFVKENTDRTAAIRALQRLPRATWPKESAPELIGVLLDSIKKTPAAERTSDAALDQFEFADALASLLPADQSKPIRTQLGELGIRVIKIGTVFEKMSYDKDIIAVQAGNPVEFILDNSDLMPHNLAITLPGALEEIGLLSEANAQKPGFAEKHYIPDSPKILAKSTLLQPRESQRLSFNVPKQPGIYPIVCTYPGHWRRMYAALYVVPDLNAYEAAPEAYLASAKIEAVDALLKDRRPRTEWKFEDLAKVVESLDHKAMGHDHGDHADHSKRSYTAGKQLFTVANCVGCHKLDNVGKEFGPDLSKLDVKLKPSDILKELLDPSAKINEKYQTNVFELQSGKVIQGLVVEESGDLIKVVENPLVSTNPILIKRNDVADRQRSKVSIMPKGLLEKLTRDEILDLVAYLASRGDKNSPLFKGHDH